MADKVSNTTVKDDELDELLDSKFPDVVEINHKDCIT